MTHPPIRHQHRVVENKFFTLFDDELVLPDGSAYHYHHIKSNFDAVIVVPVLDDGRMILESIYRHPYGCAVYEFPAGGIEPGEDPCLAGGRELQEETGYLAQQLIPLQSFEAMPGLLHMRLHFVLALHLTSGHQLQRDAMEMIDVLEVDLDTAWEYARREPASSFLTMGLLAYEHYKRGHS